MVAKHMQWLAMLPLSMVIQYGGETSAMAGTATIEFARKLPLISAK